MARLPRPYQGADGSAYINHVESVHKARKADMPESFWQDLLMNQGGSDDFLGPTGFATNRTCSVPSWSSIS
jgi:fumarylacetoacetate (FAA) hydrolase